MDRRSMPRVLYLDLATRYGGITTRGLAMLDRLPRDKIALAGLEQSPITEHARERGHRVYVVARNKLDPRIPLRLRKIIKRDEFELINTLNIQSKLWGSVTALLTGVGLVSWMGSWYLTEYSSSNRLKALLYLVIERMTDMLTDLYIVVSREIYDGLVSFGVSEEKIVLILNAISLDPDSVEEDRALVRERYGLPEDAWLGCAVGRLVESKGHRYLVQALQMVVKKHPDCYVLIMGTGHLEEKLEEEAKAAGLGKHVQFIGFLKREELLTILKSSDFYVMPSLHEGTSNALLEAGALGLPVVVTRVGGNEWIVEDEKSGLIVEPRDAEALAEAMERLRVDGTWAEALGRTLQERVQSEFGRSSQVEAVVQAWTEALRRHGRSG